MAKHPAFAVQTETKLEGAVARWIRSRARDYPDTGAAGVLKDLAYGGCQSGMVGHLIYTRDCVRFYRRHRVDIVEALRATMDDMGVNGVAELFGDRWDAADPLAHDDPNRTLLAHFAFEETARALAGRAGVEI